MCRGYEPAHASPVRLARRDQLFLAAGPFVKADLERSRGGRLTRRIEGRFHPQPGEGCGGRSACGRGLQRPRDLLPSLSADVLHLTAAAAWIGGLVSLVWLLAETRRDPASAPLARDVTRRFSTLGIASVATLFATGIVNAWILVGSFNALIVTGYGRLLMLKVGLFAVMVTFAAVNRFRLTPQLILSKGSEPQLNSLRLLTRNSTIEIVLGLAVYGIVGLLGTLHPAIHFL